MAGIVPTWAQGVERAREVLAAGDGALKLEEWIEVSAALDAGTRERTAQDAAADEHSLHGRLDDLYRTR